MSGHYHDSECMAYAVEKQADALERIADTLDDYMDMTLAVQAIAPVMTTHPEQALQGLVEALRAVSDRRSERRR
jgi:hypothetical protein